MGSGAATSSAQTWKELDPAAREPYASNSSVTYSATGRSPTQIAPALRHGHRNAAAIRRSCPEQQARLGRGEPGNPRALHRLTPVSSTAVPEERTQRGAPSSAATSPCTPGRVLYTVAPSSFREVSRLSQNFLKRDSAAVSSSSIWREGVSPVPDHVSAALCWLVPAGTHRGITSCPQAKRRP